MSHDRISFTILALAAAGLIALSVSMILRRRTTPEKREQRRRLQLNETGRLGDALVTEIDENLLYYSYSIRGVQYTASQDISSLRDRLPEDLGKLMGRPALMKYFSKNPANSMLLCEEWSGLRSASGVPEASDPSSQRTVTL
jgi:hypothetical protein